MEMMDIMYELATSKTALEMAGNQIRKLKGKCFRKNVAIAGLMWLGLTACKMLGESDSKRKAAEEHIRNLEGELALTQQALETLKSENAAERDICCDGKASIDKKEV